MREPATSFEQLRRVVGGFRLARDGRCPTFATSARRSYRGRRIPSISMASWSRPALDQ